MKKLLGLAVAAATLSACGNSSDNQIITTPNVSETSPQAAETAPDAVTPSTTELGTASSPLNVADPKNLPRAQPPVRTAPTDPSAELPTTRAIASGDIGTATFDADAGTMTVQIALDGDDVLQNYTAAGTVDGYTRFVIQDDPLDRAFTAFARESDDGGLQAFVVMDGGQFNRYFGGGAIEQSAYTAAPAGLASFAGDYVGLSNIGSLLTTGNGADPSLVPEAATLITGDVFINVDFADSQVNGSVYDRVFDPDGLAIDLQTIVLTATDFDVNGQFKGAIEFEDLSSVGTYEGALGGNEASSIAGIVTLGEGYLEDATIGGAATRLFDDVTGEAEFGIFLNERCQAGNAGCFDAN